MVTLFPTGSWMIGTLGLNDVTRNIFIQVLFSSLVFKKNNLSAASTICYSKQVKEVAYSQENIKTRWYYV